MRRKKIPRWKDFLPSRDGRDIKEQTLRVSVELVHRWWDDAAIPDPIYSYKGHSVVEIDVRIPPYPTVRQIVVELYDHMHNVRPKAEEIVPRDIFTKESHPSLELSNGGANGGVIYHDGGNVMDTRGASSEQSVQIPFSSDLMAVVTWKAAPYDEKPKGEKGGPSKWQ